MPRCRVEVVAEVELQHVAARQLLDADVPRRAVGPVARRSAARLPRRATPFRGSAARMPRPMNAVSFWSSPGISSSAFALRRRRACDRRAPTCSVGGVRVVHVGRRRRRARATCHARARASPRCRAADPGAGCSGLRSTPVDREPERPAVRLAQRIPAPNISMVLPRIDRWMPAWRSDGDPEPILEADDRAVVEAEQVLGELRRTMPRRRSRAKRCVIRK